MRRCVCVCATALAIFATAQLHADGGRLVARGTLDGKPVAVYVSPATPRAGEPLVIEVAGESVRSQLPRGFISGPGGTVALAFAAEPGDPLAVESMAMVAAAGTYEIRLDGVEAEAIPLAFAIAVAEPWPDWLTWLPCLAPSAAVGALYVLRRPARGRR